MPQNPQPEETFQPTDEMDKWMYGQTQRPNEAVSSGLDAYGRPAPPRSMLALVPYLDRLAQSPNAPETVRMLRDLIVYDRNANGG
jgi:hypothetical protein